MSRNYNEISPEEYIEMYRTVPREIYMKKHWEPLIEDAVNRYCKDKYVLDLGCGYGRYTKLISKYTDKIIGLDISQRWLDYAKKQCPHIKFILADAHKIPLEDNTFDAIVSIGLFEYVERNAVIKEMRRVLKNDGLCIISVPNKYSLCRMPNKTIYKILKKKYHPNEPSKREMLGLFQDNRFKIVEYKMNDGLIYLPDFFNKIIGMITYSSVEKFFSLFGENPFSNAMLFVSRKVSE